MRELEERNPQPPKPSTPLGSPIVGCSGSRTSAPTLKPYQLKPKRAKEPPMEQKELPSSGAKCTASGDPKKLKRMKKKLDELIRKFRHSKKRHNRLIHKRNSLRKAIEGLKLGTKPEPMPEPDWTFKECVSKLLEGLQKLLEDPRWTLIHSLTISEEISLT